VRQDVESLCWNFDPASFASAEGALLDPTKRREHGGMK
jgi:hypothetical protein